MKTAGKNREIIKFLLKHKGAAGRAVLAAGVFSLDQLMKSAVEAQPDSVFPHNAQILGDGAELQKLHNEGMMLGLGSRHKERSKRISEAAALAVFSSGLFLKRGPLSKTGESLTLAGALSNIYDKEKRGYVVDYFHIKKGPLSRIVFNLGDAAIAAGAVFEVLGSLRRRS